MTVNVVANGKRFQIIHTYICHKTCLMLLHFIPILDPMKLQWSKMAHSLWFAWQNFYIAHFNYILWSLWKLLTLLFDLWVWPRVLKVESLLALDHSDLHAKFKRNRCMHFWVIMLTNGQTDKHDGIYTSRASLSVAQ